MYCEECGFSCNCEPRELRLPPPISRKEAEDYLLKVLEWEDKNRMDPEEYYALYHMKQLEEELRKDSLTDEWKKAAWENAPILRKRSKFHSWYVVKKEKEAIKYIEAINGARKIREEYFKRWYPSTEFTIPSHLRWWWYNAQHPKH